MLRVEVESEVAIVGPASRGGRFPTHVHLGEPLPERREEILPKELPIRPGTQRDHAHREGDLRPEVVSQAPKINLEVE